MCVAELCISGSFNCLILLSDNTAEYPLPNEETMTSYANNPMSTSLTKTFSLRYWVHKNSAIPFLTDFNNMHTILMRKASQFLCKIEIRQVQLDWRRFQSMYWVSQLAPVQEIFVEFQLFACHFDEGCLTNPEVGVAPMSSARRYSAT